MLHDIHVEGNVYRLRPVTDDDAALIVELRNNPELNRFLHSTSGLIENQLAWLAQYYKRENDYYFVIERRTDGTSEGVISLYDIEKSTRDGLWGRWVLKPRSLAAVESAYLIYSFAIDRLRLDSAYSQTVMDNVKVVSFHDSCGIANRKILKRHFELASGWHDAVEHRVDMACWVELKPRLESLIGSIAKRIGRS